MTTASDELCAIFQEARGVERSARRKGGDGALADIRCPDLGRPSPSYTLRPVPCPGGLTCTIHTDSLILITHEVMEAEVGPLSSDLVSSSLLSPEPVFDQRRRVKESSRKRWPKKPKYLVHQDIQFSKSYA